MTSDRKIEANRRNALKSTGPVSTAGKLRSRCNAVRHGLTAETVIANLEDAQDYQAFEAAITADYDVQTAVERELVLRLASLLWRLRRTTAIETSLFDTATAQDRPSEPTRTDRADSTIIAANFRRSHDGRFEPTVGLHNIAWHPQSSATAPIPDDPAHELARRFLRLAGLHSLPLDRLSRYEATLWRQAGQILFTLEVLGHRPHGNRRMMLSGPRI